jgi:hypothetical protein
VRKALFQNTAHTRRGERNKTNDAHLTLYRILVTTSATHFNTLKLCILPTQCICVFRMVLTINSNCFPKQH